MLWRWSTQAKEQLAAAYSYLAEESVQAAERQLDAIRTAIENLGSFPEIGRHGRVPGTRELVVQGTPYIVAY